MKPHPTIRALTALRAKHQGSRYAVPFPDLTCPPSPCTCGFGNGLRPVVGPAPVRSVIVSHLHKSSYQVLSRTEIQYAGRKV